MVMLHLLHVPPHMVMALLSLTFTEFISTDCQDQITMNFSSNTVLCYKSQQYTEICPEYSASGASTERGRLGLGRAAAVAASAKGRLHGSRFPTQGQQEQKALISYRLLSPPCPSPS